MRREEGGRREGESRRGGEGERKGEGREKGERERRKERKKWRGREGEGHLKKNIKSDRATFLHVTSIVHVQVQRAQSV